VARAWPITVFCADTATAVRRYRVLIAHNKHSPRSVSRSTVNTTLASRLNCAHCVFIAISRIVLRANDASTTPKQRSPRFNYAPIKLFVRLNQDLITRQLRWSRSYRSIGLSPNYTVLVFLFVPGTLNPVAYKYRTTFWAASFVLQLPCCSYIEVIFYNCQDYATKRQGTKPCTGEMQSNDFKEVQESVICITCCPGSRAGAITASSLPDSSIPASTHPGPGERRRH